MLTLSYDTAIQKHLRPGEQLRWVGRPRQGLAYRWRNRIIIIEGFAAILLLVWLAKVANIGMSMVGMDLGLPLGRPSVRSSILVLLFVGVLVWQLLSERRRWAGTWYAVTDCRILFVLTSVKPESVIGIDLDDIAQLSLNKGLEELGPLNGVILHLKRIDPYLASSRVLGYQMSAQRIMLEDLEDPREFYEQVRAAKLALASRRAGTERADE